MSFDIRANPKAQLLEAWNLTPIRLPKARDEVVAVLVDAIRVGRWNPGDQLPTEREISDQLEISRVVVREAIDLLRRENILATRRGRGGGTVVTSVENLPRVLAGLGGRYRTSIRTCLEYRRILETAAAVRAAQLADEDDFERLRALVSQLGNSLELPHAEILQIDIRFHMAVGECSRNSLLAEQLSETLKEIIVLRSFLPHGYVTIEDSYQNQQAMMAALETHDPAVVRRAIDEHCAALEEASLGFRLAPAP